MSKTKQNKTSSGGSVAVVEITINELSRLTGMTARKIRDKLTVISAISKKGRQNIYDSVEALSALYNVDVDSNVNYKVELIKAQTEKLTIENNIKKENLLKYDDVVKGLGDALAILKNELMDLPAKLGKDLAYIENESEAIGILDNAIVSSLNTLSTSIENITYKK